jgi:hypothetical protein
MQAERSRHVGAYEPWLDASLVDNLKNEALDWPRVAYNVGKYMTFPEVKGIERIKREANILPTGSRNLTDLTRFALFIQTLRADAGMPLPEGGPAQGAVNMVVTSVRTLGFSPNATVETLQRNMAWEGVGRIGITPRDRMAWSYVVDALSKIDLGGIEVSAFDASLNELMFYARKLEEDGPWTPSRAEELYERASQIFIGVCVPTDETILDYTEDARLITEAHDAASPDLGFQAMAEQLGIDLGTYSLMAMALNESYPKNTTRSRH